MGISTYNIEAQLTKKSHFEKPKANCERTTTNVLESNHSINHSLVLIKFELNQKNAKTPSLQNKLVAS